MKPLYWSDCTSLDHFSTLLEHFSTLPERFSTLLEHFSGARSKNVSHREKERVIGHVDMVHRTIVENELNHKDTFAEYKTGALTHDRGRSVPERAFVMEAWKRCSTRA